MTQAASPFRGGYSTYFWFGIISWQKCFFLENSQTGKLASKYLFMVIHYNSSGVTQLYQDGKEGTVPLFKLQLLVLQYY